MEMCRVSLASVVAEMSMKFKTVPENIKKILKPAFFLSSLAGISSTSKKYRACAIFTITLNAFHLIVTPLAILHMENTEELSSQHFITKMLNPILISSVALITRILIFSSRQDVSNFIENLEVIDALLETPKTSVERNRKFIKISVCFALLISWPFQVFSVARLINNSHQQIAIQSLIFFFNVYNNFATTCCELQFVASCYLILMRFRLVHAKLKKLKPDYEKYRNVAAGKILVLKECQHMLNEACYDLNNVYRVSLFVSLTSLFVNVLLNLYFAIFGGFVEATTRDINVQPVATVINGVAWSLYYFIRFAAICAAADSLSNESNSTKVYVCDMLRGSLNRDVKEELWSFLSYALARKVKFTACGFFKIDFTLITTAVATGTTYLVILAQFHKG